jgi:hypothetical protein
MITSSRENGLRQDIERTREQLGDTVEALVHKVNVPGHVKAEEVQQQAQVKAGNIKQHVHEGIEALQAKAGEVALGAKRLTPQALGKFPPPMTARIKPLMAMARQRPLPTVAVVVGGLLVLRRLLRGNG